ncbi:hypothetical protein F5Y16DRAFT_409369 [Xylariaceae sp. FL0255]|nr:hypothetical protein F5Y16DRAFT_409369 [Xylariaceae sp. FL0255]
MEKPNAKTVSPGSAGSFQLVTTLDIKIDGVGITLTFVQFHGVDWDAKTPSKRLVKVALTAVPEVNIPLIGTLTHPFDEMYYTVEGFAVAFEKAPLTIAAIIRHGKIPDQEYYAGGLRVGWTPYQLEAAGFYGVATPDHGQAFTSAFVLARLDGPLFSLEFAEISGVTGGFGYNSDVRLPTADQIVDFPFINQSQLAGSAAEAITSLEKITDPTGLGWFKQQRGTYWAAVGMKVDAFQMIALETVVVAEFGPSTKLGIFGVATADVPDSLSKVKFAHAEAQLSPRSYVLDPDCHLTGGFALYYWLDAPHADQSVVRDFVFSLGAYHQAFDVPAGWPVPERLRIRWSLGGNIEIKGEAYFTITHKVCVGGGLFRASYHAGPIQAWFDVSADFHINYKPFHSLARAGISVGVSFNLDVAFVHIHIGTEISADLYLWGPPLAGQAVVDFKSHADTTKVDLDGFYELILQESSKNPSSSSFFQRQLPKGDLIRELTALEAGEKDINLNQKPDNQGHTFLAESGLLNDSSPPPPNRMVIDDGALINADDQQVLGSIQSGAGPIYAKPMQLSGSQHLESSLTQYKSVPTGLWGEYDSSKDPSQDSSANNKDSLLSANDSGTRLMTGMLLTAPPPRIDADRPFPPDIPSRAAWEPDKPAMGVAQWDIMHDRWKTPAWGIEDSVGSDVGTDEGSDEEEEDADDKTPGVQTQFVDLWEKAFKWDNGALSGIAQMPKMLDKRFRGTFVAAPLMMK